MATSKSTKPKKRRRDRDATQKELLAAAVRVFGARGYESATTKEIAKEAGVAEGLIQRYFEGKQGLLVAMMRDLQTDETDSCANLPPKQADFRKELKSLLLHAIEQVNRKKEHLCVAIPRAIVDKNVGKEAAKFMATTRAPAIRRRLEEHQAGGTLSRSIDPEALSFGIALTMISVGFFGQVVFRLDRTLLDRVVESISATYAPKA